MSLHRNTNFLNRLFHETAKTVDADYQNSQKAKKSSRNALEGLTLVDFRHPLSIGMRTHDNILFGMYLREPSFLQYLFGREANLVVMGDGVKPETSSNVRLRKTFPVSRLDGDVKDLSKDVADTLQKFYRENLTLR